MTKKRTIIIAIVAFLLIGLSIFAFANGKDKDEKLKDKDDKTKVEIKKEEEKEDEDDEEEYVSKYIAPVDTKNYVNVEKTTTKKDTSSSSENTETEDDSYEKALAAVIQSETDLTADTYNSAKDLVEKVTDSKKKEELGQRLEEVKNIIDATEIIERLEASLAAAESKDDIAAIVDERENSDIDNLIDAIKDEAKKNDLSGRLADIDKVIYDTTAPVIAFKDEQEAEVVVADEDIIAKVLTMLVTDDNEFNVVITKGQEAVEYNDNMVLEDGVYTVVATDKAFNETSVSFTIDTTAPVFINSGNGRVVEGGNYSTKAFEIEVDDLTFDKVEIVKTIKVEQNGSWGRVTVSNSTTTETVTTNKFTLTDEGSYVLTAYDKTGKTTVVDVKVDVAPVITITTETKTSGFGMFTTTYIQHNIEVSDQFLTSVKVTGNGERGQNQLSNNRITWSKTYKEDWTHSGEYTIEATDAHGNVTIKTFTLGQEIVNDTTNTQSAVQSTTEVTESVQAEVSEEPSEVETTIDTEEVVSQEEVVESEEVQTTETEEVIEEAETKNEEVTDTKKVEETAKEEVSAVEVVVPEEKVEEEKPIEE